MRSKMNPLVSVVMPVYNAEIYVSAAIESILNQTYQHIELIIVDDASEDNSICCIQKYLKNDNRIKFFRNNQNKGIGYSRNIGINNSNGEYIALMDADDIAYADRIEVQVEYLEQNKEIDAVAGYYDWIMPDGKIAVNNNRMNEYSPVQVAIRMMFECVVADSSAMYRKSMLLRYKISFPEDFPAVGGYKFWCEFALHANIVILPVKYYQYRINQEGLTQTTKRKNRKERYEWHNKVHEFYWNAWGIKLGKKEKEALLKETNGKHISKLIEIWYVKTALRIIQQQISKKPVPKVYLEEAKRISAEILKKTIFCYCLMWYYRISGKTKGD